MGELGRTIRGLAYDPVHDEIVVPNALADAIIVFRGDAIGAVAPIRIIQGSRRNWYHRMLSALTGLTAMQATGVERMIEPCFRWPRRLRLGALPACPWLAPGGCGPHVSSQADSCPT